MINIVRNFCAIFSPMIKINEFVHSQSSAYGICTKNNRNWIIVVLFLIKSIRKDPSSQW